MQKFDVAFLGLGVMGFPMAGHLAQAGHRVTVYNRTAAKAEAWLAKYPGKRADTPAAAAGAAQMVFSCVGNDNDLREITLGKNGAFSAMKADTVYIDHTTASAEIARELFAVARQSGFHFLDAPVSGGQAGAENGKLTVMVGGEEAAFERSKDMIACFARAVTLMGAAGAGQLTKMVNQICIAGTLQGLAEATHFGLHSNLDMALVFDVIAKGAAQSWQMENRGNNMVAQKFDYGFAVDWMRKDLGICLAEARKNGAELPLTALIEQFYAKIQAQGGGRMECSSLITLLEPLRKA